MPTGKSLLRKEIVKTLSRAIDYEMGNDENNAYILYAESLKLVANALQFGEPDMSGQISDKKYKRNLLEFANQSLSRINLILNKDEEESPSKCYPPSAPAEIETNPVHSDFSRQYKVMENELVDTESQILVERYKQRMLSTPSASERQNLELELARQLVEKMAIVRKKFIESSTFAMQSGDRIFQIQEKLVNGTLRESDLRKQQLYGMSFQYHQCHPVMDISISDIRSTMRGQQLVRELITTVLDANGHPLNYALNNMKKKVMSSLLSIPEDLASFQTFAAGVKEDLSILIDTLKALFEELVKEKYSIFAFRIVHEFYFKDIKPYIIKYLRNCFRDVEGLLTKKFSEECDEFQVDIDEDCFNEAVTKLHYLTTLNSPYDMIDCLTVVIKLLATSQFDRDHTSSIGADDLLPKICHVILSSRLDSILCELEFVEAFTPSDQALGEGGYAVTAVSSALKYLTQQS